MRLRKLFVLPMILGLLALPATAAAAVSGAQPLSQIERQVRHELVTLPFYTIFDNFQFQVNGGEVTLLGQVHRPSLKKSAERVVSRIEGVTKVSNNIQVLPLSSHDDDLRLAIYFAVYGHPALNRYALRSVPSIHIIVNNGHVTLEGVVNRDLESTVAFLQASSVPGAFSVTNNLRVEVPSKKKS